MRLDDFMDESDPLMPAGFEVVFGVIVVLIVLGFIAAVITAVMRYRTTKRLALQSGMSEADATNFAATSPQGMEAAFLASQLRAGAAQPSAESRLAELTALRDKGLITAEEFDAKRRAILDGL